MRTVLVWTERGIVAVEVGPIALRPGENCLEIDRWDADGLHYRVRLPQVWVKAERTEERPR